MPHRHEQGGARFVGNAQPVAGVSVTRLLNAACYLISGIAAFVIATKPGFGGAWPVILGIGAIAYGIKILTTRSSYWVSSVVYVVTFFAVASAIGIH